MSNHAEKCPVCNGKGTIPENNRDNSIVLTEKTCHGCNGKGWIEVENGSQVVPIYPSPNPYPYLEPYPNSWQPYPILYWII